MHTLRTIAQEAASQKALRDCTKEVREELGHIRVFTEKKKKCNRSIATGCQKTDIEKLRKSILLFCIWAEARVWATDIIPLICILS